MTDPLAGQRTLINEDRGARSLLWPDKGRGCPVKVGELYSLRRCGIEITRVHRVQRSCHRAEDLPAHLGAELAAALTAAPW